MPIMKWDESFSVKVAEIDKQHQTLVEMLNELYDMMKIGKGKDVIGPLLNDLTEYTVEHFGTEEKYFDKFGFEESARHKHEHKKFVNQVSKFKQEFDDGTANLSIDLMNFLKNWLVEHIKGSDQRYIQCFNENGLN
ncbi:hemerythrin-like metal-binding protein [Methanohalophilus levihalophilus]|nr:hemerythrin-like metal-binding protein [Methanohalophilus levihalophilus]